MDCIKINWKDEKQLYSNCKAGMIGKWKLFHVRYNKIHRNDPPYVLRCYLPGIKDTSRFESEEDAINKAEEILAFWIKGLLESE